MKKCTKKALSLWAQSNPRVAQWIWFIALWFGGLLTVFALTFPVKILILQLN